ncbi:transposase, partial [Butyricicoccus sp. 1XD8-22]
MTDTYIALEIAANFEGVKYKTLAQRIIRDPARYETKAQPRESGGKAEIMVAVSSLSPKARRAWRAAQKADGRD